MQLVEITMSNLTTSKVVTPTLFNFSNCADRSVVLSIDELLNFVVVVVVIICHVIYVYIRAAAINFRGCVVFVS